MAFPLLPLLRKVFKGFLGLNLCGDPAQGSLSVKFNLVFLRVCVYISKRKREEDEVKEGVLPATVCTSPR